LKVIDITGTNLNDLPSTQELIDKISQKRYQVGVKKISSGFGFDWTNYAPACFEYEIQLERISGDIILGNERHSSKKYEHNQSRSNITKLNYKGTLLYVFPNDLSGNSYHWWDAIGACNRLNRLGYDDWYLPTKEELNFLYMNKEKIDGLTDGWYWSSTESSKRDAWVQSFRDSDQSTEYKGIQYNIHKGNLRVRCIRKD